MKAKSREWLGVLVIQWGFWLLSGGEYALILAGVFSAFHFFGMDRDLALACALCVLVSIWVDRLLVERREQSRAQLRLLEDWREDWRAEMREARERREADDSTILPWEPPLI